MSNWVSPYQNVPILDFNSAEVLEVVVTTGAGVVKYLNTQVFKYYLNTVTGI